MAELTLEARSEAELALSARREHLLSLQDEQGWWRGELQTNVTMDAEDMLLREFLGIRRPAETERSAAWIRSQQRDDGTWANFHGGPRRRSRRRSRPTGRCAWPATRPRRRTCARRPSSSAPEGGLERARVFTHLWLALFGLWSWERVPALPPEVMLLPPRVPLNVYDFACWARQTIVALAIVKAHRPVRPLPFDLAELDASAPGAGGGASRAGAAARARARRGCSPAPRPRCCAPTSAARSRRCARLALARAERWIVRRQEADGSWGGIQPPWVYSLIALRLRGYPLEHPVMRRGLEGIETFMVEDRDDSRGVGAPAGRRAGAWKPASRPSGTRRWRWSRSATRALAGEHPAIGPGRRVAARRGGHGAAATGRLRGRGLAPGGWAFEFANVNYPDVDDTAEVVLALRAWRLTRTPGRAAAGAAAAAAAPRSAAGGSSGR